MIYNYSQHIKDLFYTDSIRKSLTINLSENPIDLLNYEYTDFEIYKSLSDEDIISESMEFSEALSEEIEFTFRSFSLPQLSVDRIFEQKDFTGCACTCILSIYEEDGETIAANIMLLSGYVVSDEASEDRQTRKMSCIDSVSQLFEKEIFSLSNVNKTEMSILNFISAISVATKINFFKGVYDENGILDVEEINTSTFPELNYNVDFTNYDKSYTVKDFLSDFCEITGCFFVFNKQNSPSINNSYLARNIILIRPYLDMDLLYPKNSLYPDTSLYPLFGYATQIYTKPPVVHKIDWYINAVISTSSVMPYKYFSVYVGNKEIFNSTEMGINSNLEYKISNNVLLEKANENEITNIVAPVDFLLRKLSYFVIKLDMPYLAYLQPGDFIMFESEWGTYVLPVIKTEVKGINSLTSKVTCELKTQ